MYVGTCSMYSFTYSMSNRELYVYLSECSSHSLEGCHGMGLQKGTMWLHGIRIVSQVYIMRSCTPRAFLACIWICWGEIVGLIFICVVLIKYMYYTCIRTCTLYINPTRTPVLNASRYMYVLLRVLECYGRGALTRDDLKG